LLDLVKAKEDEFAFSTAPTSFVNMIVHLFEKPLDDLAKIPDLEPKGPDETAREAYRP
jgi:hypothetical protein